ncbi:polyprenyl synthetase family protein [Branchiibius sp. NY16-3462-2]|uniref:polyprenyl synthetase family protein n=1 Tax=Branchiibius sp. NY16-3462-2 TaxID=1807500 RepID=UPI0007957DA4|nr:polyprenyl synthetase family protein [Branchiibius sp. NY16-3462-2]KYH43081.1 hypothetical protein AZH51_06430 [Branchiibius sp. NY16-3462-2]
MNAEASYLPQAHSDLVPGRDQTLHAVDDLLKTRLAELRTVLADAGCNRVAASPTLHIDLIDELELRLGDPGKRLRPSLAHRGWVLSGGDRRTWSALVRVAAAMELLHLFGLVHDDIMDRSSTRRGRQTLHVSSALQHRSAGAAGDAEHFGDSVAILLGDLALSEANALVGACSGPVRDAWRVMSAELVQGQLMDLTHAADRRTDAVTSTLIARLKSGRYTITRPLQLGALVAGSDQAWVDRLVAWGDVVGDAFALRDDVLGIWGDPAVMGKPAGDDLLEGKPTVLRVWAAESLDDSSRSLLAACDDGTLDADGVEQLRQAMERCGVRRRAEQELRALVARAMALIPGLTSDPDAADELRALVEAIAWRAA